MQPLINFSLLQHNQNSLSVAILYILHLKFHLLDIISLQTNYRILVGLDKSVKD